VGKNFGVSNINFDIRFFAYGGGLYKYPMKNILRTAKFLTTWGFNQRYFLGLHISGEQRGAGYYAWVTGSDVTGNGPDRK
jgi:hypothetical protein